MLKSTIPFSSLFVVCIALAGCEEEDPSDTMSNTSTLTNSTATTTDSSATSIPTTTLTDSTGMTGSQGDTSSSLGTTSGADTTSDTTTACKRYDASTVEGCPAIVGESFCEEPAIHIPADVQPTWGQNPPNSGMHDSRWDGWGIKSTPTPRRNWVHNLEHGGVVFLYRCPNGCPIEIDTLGQVVAQRPKLRIIVTEDPELPSEGVAAVSWTWGWKPQQLTLAEALCFADQHEGHAPEDIQ